MNYWTVGELVRATGGKLVSGADKKLRALCTDTRKLLQGDVFVALRGEKFDGHDYLAQAASAGAVCAVVDRPAGSALSADFPVILVEDTLKALQDAACYHRQRFSLPVIAVTGSNGKTTTKDMTAAVLSEKYRTLKTFANFNNEIGLPQTLLQLDESFEAAVVEMGMRGRGEIKELAAIAKPTMGIVTNVGLTHIELLGSLDNIAAAKAELVEAMESGATVFLNADDELVAAMAKKTRARVVTYGLGQADVRAGDIEVSQTNMVFNIYHQAGQFKVEMPLPGRHNIYNALAAAAVGLELGVEPDAIVHGLANLELSAMRMQIINLPEGATLINDAYNASPLSMQAALETVASMPAKRRICVLGDMLELGEVSRQQHLEIGRSAANLGFDYLFTIGSFAADINRGAKEQGMANAVHFAGFAELTKKLRTLVGPDDVVLVKGSRGMKMEQVVLALDKQ